MCFRRFALATVCLAPLALTLSSCSGDLDGRSKITTYGPVSSPAFSAVRGQFASGGSIDSADILVVDGNGRAPGGWRDDEVIQNHLAKGKVVMFVDLTPDHKSGDLTSLVLAARTGPSYATLVRRGQDAYGRPLISMLDFPQKSNAPATREELLAFTRSVRPFMAGNTVESNGPGDNAPPEGLIYVIFDFAEPTLSTQFTNYFGGKYSNRGVQNTSQTRNQRYTLFLENKNEPTGDRQWLVVHSNIQSSPINANLGTNQIMEIKTGSTFVSCALAWFQVAVQDWVTPASTTVFIPQDAEPQNTIRQSTVRTGVSFSLGFSGAGGTGSFQYQSTTQNNVTNWNVLNNSSGVVGQWAWENQDPWMYNDPGAWPGYGGWGTGVHGAGEFRMPNDLAMGEIVTDTKIVYVTDAIQHSSQIFNHESIVTYQDVWAPAFGRIGHRYSAWQNNVNYAINMAAVVPIPISSITFSQNPVNASSPTQVNCTVTLAKPAVADTQVFLTAESPYENASVPNYVRIPQGQTSATFPVNVNANLIPNGQQAVATITAFNAQSYNAQLTITNNP